MNKKESLSTKTKKKELDDIWSKAWDSHTLKSQIIALKKNEGLRWKLKFAPNHGRFLEAGCGNGQYVYYFNDLNHKTDGLDISVSAIKNCRKFCEDNENYSNITFTEGDVRDTKYDDSSISYYLSFGVIEHFKEGPEESLKEALRILKPGGIAYFGTPQRYSLTNNKEFIGWFFFIHEMPRRILSSILKKLGIIKSVNKGWIENHWTLKELKKHVKDSGFLIIDSANIGLKSTFDINWRPSRKYLNMFLKKIKPIFYPLLDKLEDGYFGKFGINNVVMAMKPGKFMHCFFCGDVNNYKNLNLDSYSVCTCESCLSNVPSYILKSYHRGHKPKFKKRIYKKKPLQSETICSFCNSPYEMNSFFGDYGFDKNFCEICIKDKLVNLELRNKHLKYTNI